ncbi:MAG: DUF5686 family protein [Bacteroidota bacterium]|nr:DUF5686 family protein [Bacteroidota bacterium]
MRINVILIFIIFIWQLSIAQYIIKGKVVDANTGEPLPFVVLQFKGTTIGAQTDFDGKYIIKSSFIKDSLKATYVGYKTRSKIVKDQPEQTINFQLSENLQELGEVVVKRGENPAWEIIRRAIKNKPNNDRRNLTGYEYNSYTKLQVDIDNISNKIRKKWYMKNIMKAIDSMKKVTNDEGKPVIPVYMSEALSKIYYRDVPVRKKELIEAQKITGVLDESTQAFIAQVSGSLFTDFNFYQNWMRFLGKDFVSPIADSWKEFYEYDLEDSVQIGGEKCYRIDVKPKREGDLAFKGKIWIAKNDYALKQIDVSTGKGTNINFVEKVKIQQELIKTDQGAYITGKMRFLIDMADLGDSTAGMLIKFYVSNKDIKTNEPKPLEFFDLGVEIKEDAKNYTNEYWDKSRHDTLSENDKRVIQMVDTIKNLPIVKTYIEVIDIIVNGYKKVGWIEFGPYLEAIAINNVEGFRGRVGFLTNMKFSKKMEFRGFIAYGTRDDKAKYGLTYTYWFSKKKWFLIGASHNYELDQVALVSNVRTPGSSLFYATSRWGDIEFGRPLYYRNTSFFSQIDYLKGCTQRIELIHRDITGSYNRRNKNNFEYYPDLNDTTLVNNSLTNTEIVFESRFAKRETYLYFDHNRITGRAEFPIITFRYTLGLKGILGSNYSYNKFQLNIFHRFTVGKFGQSIINTTGTYIPNILPYPMLIVHLGNPTPFYNSLAFNMMRSFEFVSDRAVTINYQHKFMGYFFNRVPLFNRLKWREVVSFNAIIGTVTPESPKVMVREEHRFKILDPSLPYMEAGYGIENIFKFVRIEMYHRLTYLEGIHPWQNWGIKAGVQLAL